MALAFSAVPQALADAGDDGEIGVFLDQSRLVKLPERVATLIIGNPMIADVSVQSGSLMVVTGKGYGVTNVIALDRNGVALMERRVQVKGPQASTLVVLSRRAARNLTAARRFASRA
jgi:Flp pilus assembly secretin CpaC